MGEWDSHLGGGWLWRAYGRGDLVACNLENYSLPQYHLLQYGITVFIVTFSMMAPSLECMFSEGWSLLCLDDSCTTSPKGCAVTVSPSVEWMPKCQDKLMLQLNSFMKLKRTILWNGLSPLTHPLSKGCSNNYTAAVRSLPHLFFLSRRFSNAVEFSFERDRHSKAVPVFLGLLAPGPHDPGLILRCNHC